LSTTHKIRKIDYAFKIQLGLRKGTLSTIKTCFILYTELNRYFVFLTTHPFHCVESCNSDRDSFLRRAQRRRRARETSRWAHPPGVPRKQFRCSLGPPINGATRYSSGATQQFVSESGISGTVYLPMCVLTRVGRMWNIANGMKQPRTHTGAHVHTRATRTCARCTRRGCAPTGV